MIKRGFVGLVLAGLLSAAPLWSMGQEGGGGGQAGNSDQPAATQPEHGPGRFDPERRTEMLSKRLNLSSDQQAKVQDILKSQQSQMESLRSDTSTSQQDRRSKMMEIHKSAMEQVRTVLTPDQQKKFDEMQNRREERMQGRHPRGQNPGQTPEPEPQN